jgi:GTPase SAR1 family protein/ankyrin repeat protein
MDLISVVKTRNAGQLDNFLQSASQETSFQTQVAESIRWCCKNAWYEGAITLLRANIYKKAVDELIGSKSEDGRSLFYFIATGHTKNDQDKLFNELVTDIYARGEDINQRDSNGSTALMKAIELHHVPLAKYLLSLENIKLDLTDMKRLNVLDKVILANNENIAEDLVKNRKEYNTKDYQLNWIKYQSHVVGFMASIYSNINEEKLDTYFMNAIHNGLEKQINFFLDKKINVSAVDPRDGKHIFCIAASAGYFTLCKTLMKKTTIIMPRTEWVHVIAWNSLKTEPIDSKHEAEFVKLFKSLIKNKDVNVANRLNGETLLHEACFRGNVTAIKILMKAGANPMAVTARGETALHYLTRCTKVTRHAEITKLLFEPLVGDQRQIILQSRGPEGSVEQVARKYNLVDLLSAINQIRGFRGDDLFWSVLWLLIPTMTRDQVISLTYVNKRLRAVCSHEIFWAGRDPAATCDSLLPEYDEWCNELLPNPRDQMILARYYRQRARGEYFKLLLTKTNHAQFNDRNSDQIVPGMTLAQLSSSQKPSMEYAYLFDEANNPLLIGFKSTSETKKKSPAKLLSGLMKKMSFKKSKDSIDKLKASQEVKTKADADAEDDDLIKDFEAKGQHIFKVLLLGDVGVGKTSVLLRFIENRYNVPDSELETILAGDFVETAVCLQQKLIRLQIWDTVHLEKLRNACKPHRNADIALIHFDLTNKTTFDRLSDWASWVSRDCSTNTRLLVVGCKSDSVKRKVTTEEAKAKSAQIGASYIETCALLDRNCDLAYWLVANQTLQYIHAGVQLNMTNMH